MTPSGEPSGEGVARAEQTHLLTELLCPLQIHVDTVAT